MKNIIFILGLILFLQLGYSQSRLQFNLAITGNDVEPFPIDIDGSKTHQYDVAQTNKNNYKFFPMAIGLNIGVEYALIQNRWLSIHSGLNYSLVGSRVNVDLHPPFGPIINKSVYAHYAQIPLKLSINVLNPFYFYAGASFNYAVDFGNDFETVYSTYLLKRDWRSILGLGWRIKEFSIYAQYEESLFHYGKKLPIDNKTLVQPKNTIVSLGVTVPLDVLKK